MKQMKKQNLSRKKNKNNNNELLSIKSEQKRKNIRRS